MDLEGWRVYEWHRMPSERFPGATNKAGLQATHFNKVALSLLIVLVKHYSVIETPLLVTT